MSDRELAVAVIMERSRLASRWADHRWEAIGVVPDRPDPDPAGRCIVADESREQWLYAGRWVRLYRDEAENYLLNVTAEEPRVFVMWRLAEALAVPEILTVSYGEAARMMDAGEQVDGVPMPPDIHAWVSAFARAHYRPPERKPKRYASSKSGSGKR